MGTIRQTFPPPQIWEENGGASYSPNVAYLACYRISVLKDVIKYFTTFFASNFFFLFSSSKTCVSYGLKNTVSAEDGL